MATVVSFMDQTSCWYSWMGSSPSSQDLSSATSKFPISKEAGGRLAHILPKESNNLKKSPIMINPFKALRTSKYQNCMKNCLSEGTRRAVGKAPSLKIQSQGLQGTRDGYRASHSSSHPGWTMGHIQNIYTPQGSGNDCSGQMYTFQIPVMAKYLPR